MEEEKDPTIMIGSKVCKTPVVSIVIPVHSVAEFISDTLDSVLDQSFKDNEIILVNDGSPDTRELEEVLEKYFDKIVYIKQANHGPAHSRNTAIENSRGELVAFLDGDDIWLPEYLTEQIGFLRRHKLEMVYADAFLFGNVPSLGETFMHRSPSVGVPDFEGMVSGRCNVVTSGTVVYRQRLIDAGMFDVKLPRNSPEDFDMWLRLSKAGVKIGYQKRALMKYRLRPNSLSGNSVQRAQRRIDALNIVKDKFDLGPSERIILDDKLVEASAELLLEKGKAYLLLEDFAKARRSFQAANQYYKNTKLKLIDLALVISPKTLLTLFKRFRAKEIPFIATSADI